MFYFDQKISVLFPSVYAYYMEKKSMVDFFPLPQEHSRRQQFPSLVPIYSQNEQWILGNHNETDEQSHISKLSRAIFALRKKSRLSKQNIWEKPAFIFARSAVVRFFFFFSTMEY